MRWLLLLPLLCSPHVKQRYDEQLHTEIWRTTSHITDELTSMLHYCGIICLIWLLVWNSRLCTSRSSTQALFGRFLLKCILFLEAMRASRSWHMLHYCFCYPVVLVTVDDDDDDDDGDGDDDFILQENSVSIFFINALGF